MMTYLYALSLAIAANSAAFNLKSPLISRLSITQSTRSRRTKLFSADESVDNLDETLLRVNFSVVQGSGNFVSYATNALESVRSYTKSFPFAAVLPVQPLTYLPSELPDGTPALKVTFLRKKTAEKGSQDGGILFTSRLVSEEDYTDAEGLENYALRIELQAKRIKEGQTIPKVFSEKQICLAFIKGLSEAKGQEILGDGGGVVIDSVFHIWMDA